MKKYLFLAIIASMFLGCSSSQKLSYVDTRFGRYEFNPSNEKYFVTSNEGFITYKLFENTKLKFYKETVVEIENIIKNEFYDYCKKNKVNISQEKIDEISYNFVKNYNYHYRPVNSRMDTLSTNKYSYYVVYKIDKSDIRTKLYEFMKEKYPEYITLEVEKYFAKK
ncbi:MAG TPA: hypothetical protein PLP99_11485 [Ignavibacteriales bacterium]|nr:hypothetical protein [Ignavibacteriales bacterium]HOL82358.1 hypothetical protein [Ignavibacteriales bacterium]HOM66404.1 hypothetical protein [Ignavibacteriales bacterium]HPP34584.1 hypothetical protein [Ignavibacteriales bacterium]HRR19736.1 hypothetical protein [Ignavibacteriales bacterium]